MVIFISLSVSHMLIRGQSVKTRLSGWNSVSRGNKRRRHSAPLSTLSWHSSLALADIPSFNPHPYSEDPHHAIFHLKHLSTNFSFYLSFYQINEKWKKEAKTSVNFSFILYISNKIWKMLEILLHVFSLSSF